MKNLESKQIKCAQNKGKHVTFVGRKYGSCTEKNLKKQHSRGGGGVEYGFQSNAWIPTQLYNDNF